MIRVMIADDHNLVRQGIRALIEKQAAFEVVAETEDGAETIEVLNKKEPDVLIMDISMPRLTGVQVLERMHLEHIKTQVVILSMYSDEQLISQAIKLGAKAYLLKNSLKEELVQAIFAANRQEYYINQVVSNVLLDHLIQKQPEVTNPLELLTSREKEVLKLIAEGYTNTAMAGLMQISIKTVEKHRANLLIKTKAQDTAALIRLAIKYHLVFLDEEYL
jgi:DNA-binding NarL/FixJ family response regulator